MSEDYLPTPSALTIWTLGTGFLGGVASMLLARRAEKAGWSKVKTGYVIFGILAASAMNIYLAAKIQGEK